MSELIAELKQFAIQYGYSAFEEDDQCFVLRNPDTGDAFCETKDNRGIRSVRRQIEFQQECRVFCRSLGLAD